MRILTISLNAWNNSMATGNTFSNFFGDANDEVEFANIFCREEAIENTLCKKYFRVTEKDIIRSLIDRSQPCGHEQTPEPAVSKSHMTNSRFSSLKHLIFHKWRPSSFLFARELIWSLNNWKSDALNKFVTEFNPDIIYMHGHNNWYMHRLLWHCQAISKAKIALFFGDDMYGYKSRMPLSYIYQKKLRSVLRQSVSKSDLLLGGSHELCDEYSGIFNRHFLPQFKTCSLPQTIDRKLSQPFEIVYAGNLLYGRDRMLITVANAINNVNQKFGNIFKLSIYSNSTVDKKTKKLLDNREYSFIFPPRPYKEIVKILNETDFTVFIESFKKSDIANTRLSFSTKIIDYLQSASGLIVYGPRNIASVSYLINSNIGLFADSQKSIEKLLESIYRNPEIINESLKNKRETALKNHSQHLLLSRMRQCIDSKDA